VKSSSNQSNPDIYSNLIQTFQLLISLLSKEDQMIRNGVKSINSSLLPANVQNYTEQNKSANNLLIQTNVHLNDLDRERNTTEPDFTSINICGVILQGNHQGYISFNFNHSRYNSTSRGHDMCLDTSS